MADLPTGACPYKGLQPYTEEDTDFFFGRERDREIIISNLYASPLTVLYGASGVGKSSVLLAAVVPKLRKTPRLAVVVFRDWQDAGIVEGLKAATLRAVEECTGRPVEVDAALPLDEFLLACSRAIRGPIFFVFDQFEEYFLYHAPSQDEDSFEVQLARTVNREDIEAHFLLSMREDGLSELDRFQGRIPNLLGNLLRLDHLDRKGAEAGIRLPLAEYNRRLPEGEAPVDIEDALVEAVIAQVKTGQVTIGEGGQGQVRDAARRETRIETPFLQMVLTRLWEEESRTGSRTLREKTLAELGGAKRIVRTHLDTVMKALGESERDVAARLFHHLVTPSGTKIALSTDDLASYAARPAGRLIPVLESLADARILRPISPPPGQADVQRYEIFHDVLAPAVLDWRQRYVAQNAAALREREEHQRRKRLVHATFLLGAGLIFALGLVGLSLWQWLRANDLRKLAQARLLAGQAELTRNQRGSLLPRSVLLAIEAMKRYPSLEADQPLRHGLALLPRPVGSPMHHDAEVRAVVFNPDGRSLATASGKDVQIWDASTGRKIALPMHHDDAVNDVLFHPGGKYLATTSQDDTARLWEVNGGRLVKRFGSSVNAVTFSSDGRYLATASAKTVSIWSVPGGEPACPPLKNDNYIFSVAFSKDAKYLATGDLGKAARLWSVDSGQPIGPAMKQSKDVITVAFSSDGRILASGSADGTAKLWDVGSGRSLATLRHKGSINSVSFSPNNQYLVTASNDTTAQVWTVTDGHPFGPPLKHEGRIYTAQFSPDGLHIVTASRDNTARIWEINGGQEVACMAHDGVVFGAAYSPDGTHIATASGDQTARIWEAKSAVVPPLNHGGSVPSVAFSPRGTQLATACGDGIVRLWNTTTGQTIARLAHWSEVTAVAFSPDGRYLATADLDNQMRVWEIRTSREVVRIDDGFIMKTIAFSPDGKYVSAAGYSAVVTVRDALSGRRVARLEPGGDRDVLSIAFHPDGQHIATTDSKGITQLWNFATGLPIGKPMKRLATADIGEKRGLAFSPDGKHLAVTSPDGSVRILDTASDKEVGPRMQHEDAVYAAAFSPDGKYLATASEDNTARIWKMTSHREVVRVKHESGVLSVAFSPDGKYLATSSWDNTARLWLWRPDDLMEEACRRLPRNLTREEWKRYLPDESYHRTCPGLP